MIMYVTNSLVLLLCIIFRCLNGKTIETSYTARSSTVGEKLNDLVVPNNVSGYSKNRVRIIFYKQNLDFNDGFVNIGIFSDIILYPEFKNPNSK